jgi:UDP-MurNAc hydroxylase
LKFTIVSHAGMLVESNGTSLITDPWILGSCYFRSWWNYPKPPVWVTRLEALDYIYLTHMHWDHFQGPSLRKLPSSATLLIPEAHFERMRRDALSFKFREVVELPHGRTFTLKGGLQVTSYQYALFMDSALVISDGRTTLFNLNDCKITGAPLRQLLARHPQPDFVFRSHSSASAYPHCVTADEPEALRYRSDEDYLREFAETARVVGARHAIPFASNVCFLHRETRRYNQYAVSPLAVKQYFDAHGPEGCRCTVMVPGDSWSDAGGFRLSEHDYFTNREAHLEAYAREVAGKLQETYRREAQAECSFGLFQRYFQAQLDALPRLSRLLFRAVVVFGLSDRDPVYWVVDFDRRRVYEAEALPPDYAIHVRVPAAVLRDCIRRRLFASWSASKRVSIHVARGHVRDYLVFFQLLDMFECEFFPLRRWLRPRFLRVWARRWRELSSYLALAFKVAFRARGSDPLAAFVPKVSTGSRGP